MMGHKTKLYIRIAIITVGAGAIVGYAFWKANALIEGPRIVIETPENGATLDESLVAIRGIAENAAEISLNGRKIFISETGEIREEVLLSYGYNVVELYAKDRFGRETKKALELVYK